MVESVEEDPHRYKRLILRYKIILFSGDDTLLFMLILQIEAP